MDIVTVAKGPEAALYTLYTTICIYYMVKLYLFYKRLSTNALNSRDNLYETYYDIRVHVEMYKSYTYAMSPFAILTAIVAIMITTEIWISRYYNKYARQIRKLLDRLKEEEEA